MASNNSKWYKKIFGEKLIQCKELSNDNLNVSNKNFTFVDEIFENLSKVREKDSKIVIGLYFTPIEGVPDESTNYLIQLYHLINSKTETHPNSNVYENNYEEVNHQRKTLLEVIQVFLTNSVHWLDRSTLDETMVLEQLKDFPWFAVPVGDRERVVSLLF